MRFKNSDFEIKKRFLTFVHFYFVYLWKKLRTKKIKNRSKFFKNSFYFNVKSKFVKILTLFKNSFSELNAFFLPRVQFFSMTNHSNFNNLNLKFQSVSEKITIKMQYTWKTKSEQKTQNLFLVSKFDFSSFFWMLTGNRFTKKNVDSQNVEYFIRNIDDAHRVCGKRGCYPPPPILSPNLS